MPTGPSTTQTPFLTPTSTGVTFTSIISVGDSLPGSTKKFVGIPDGIGAFDNGNGTITVLLNHELPNTSGVVRDHGSKGAFVEKLVIDINTLKVLSASDLATSASNVFTADAGGNLVAGTFAWNRFCSGSLADQSAFFDAATGLGTKNHIYMTGEEGGDESKAFAFIVDGPEAGKAYELNRLGNMSYENAVASPNSGSKTVVMMQDDTSPRGQVYVYVGNKQSTGLDIDKAGLTNGAFYAIKVNGLVDELTTTAVPAAGIAFSLNEIGPSGNVGTMTGAQISAEGTAEGVTNFLRPEDGAWDKINANRYYFVTTDAINAPARLWALDFNDVKNPTAGGTIKMLLDGTEGQVMMDNITVDGRGHVIICEDPGTNDRLAKVWDYNPFTDTLTQLAEHDPARFSSVVNSGPFNTDEESSGVLDVTSLFNLPNKSVYLIDTQAHFSFGAATETVENGQLQLMVVDKTIQKTGINIGSHPAGWLPSGIGDFNADGTSDLAWYNSSTNSIDIWKLSNGQWAGSVSPGPHPVGYQPVSFEDFSHDGTSDVLWFNPTTRNVDLWKISNGQWAGTVDVGTHPAGSTPALFGDFSGDGTTDIAWHNPTTNAIDIWKIVNGQWAGSVDAGAHPAGYQPALAGDFNGDGTKDIAWFNPTTGDVDIWKLSNGQWAGSVGAGKHPAGWQPLGAADVNVDGTSDIVWYNPTTNNIDVWLIKNGQWAFSLDIGTHAAGAVAVGVGDFDHNGVSDIMWRDTTTGAIDNWMLSYS